MNAIAYAAGAIAALAITVAAISAIGLAITGDITGRARVAALAGGVAWLVAVAVMVAVEHDRAEPPPREHVVEYEAWNEE